MITVATLAILVGCIFPCLSSIRYLLGRLFHLLNDLTHPHQTFLIPRHDEVTSLPNPFYLKALAYVTSLLDSDAFYLQLSPTHTLTDIFHGARIRWIHHGHDSDSSSIELRIRRHDRHRVLRPYLHHVESVADDIESRQKEVQLFVNYKANCWRPVPFTHPSTMDTIVMGSELKSKVKSDLENFTRGKSYYSRIGRVWKRSYLLYGPPGTGKSTFVAAMAKFVNYDIYDLDLSKISDGSDLETLLLQTTPKSVILVEDLDRYEHLRMLSLMDGVFSCCGEERFFVFTTRKERVLTKVRFDMQIYFPLCDFVGFKSLASGYLGLKDHKLSAQVDEGFERGTKRLSRAEIGEIMIANRGSPTRAIKSVIEELNNPGLIGNDDDDNGGLMGSDRLINISGRSPMREIKKLYGLMSRRRRSKRDGRMSVETAAAAAAAKGGGAVVGLKRGAVDRW